MPYPYQPSRFPGRLQILSAFVGMVVVFFLIASYLFVNAAWLREPNADAKDIPMTVEETDIFGTVASRLHQNDIASSFWLRVYARLFDVETVYPGTYVFQEGMSYSAIIDTLQSIQSTSVRITIPEGFSLVQMGERIHAALPEISLEAWQFATSAKSELASDPFVVSAGKPSGVDLEGYLFPDTYEFNTDATADVIAETMLRTMETRVNEIGVATGDSAGMSTHDILTLASIVEKEVRTAETMKNVADVFLKRLDIGMPLQSDATINYIIDGDNPSPTYADLEVDSPYNTYKNPGLPPGPISAPGLNALNAVLHPTHNDYYYFLTTDEGDIYYAETYEEHLRNKARYL
ncbi:MAG: endolytic transglycosylase MltG [Patescibacteria group bacterium]|jgi:UPF0755 protein